MEHSYSSATVPLSSSARGWVDRISGIFRNEMAVDIDHLPPVSVFEVPKTLSLQKPEAYTPQLIAMGPYHHLRPELYQMERYKLAAIKEISTPEQISNFQRIVINRLKEIDPSIRACYNKFMDYDQDTLAWIVAIDGCFFLHILHSYLVQDETTDRRLLDNTIVTTDIMMLENQIPFVLLKEVRKSLQVSPKSNDQGEEDDIELISMLFQFCEAQSPVKFCIDKTNQVRYHRPLHLLDMMYHMIINVPGCVVSGSLEYSPIQPKPTYTEFRNSSTSSSSSSSTDSEDPDVIHNNLEALLDLVETIAPKPTQHFLRPVKVVSSIPWSTISGLYRKGDLGTGEQNSGHGEIAIPSVSHLWRYAKVQCKPFIGSIKEIKFVEEEAALYLPVMNLNASSEVITRNLVAYEAAMYNSTLEFARYVNLMNGIIDTAEDVKLLKQNGVIKGALTDGEIADQFNGMKRCYAGSDHKSNIEVAVEKVNKFYGKKLLVRTVRGLKKNLYASWKCLALVSTGALLVVLSLQTFCEFYQCHKLWNFHQES
ncbi:putative UPF0481 protein At3g02645 [Coffea eugenioides]|uniref:putative UPF0481 protein At3g02645 n=1 Tax=Coffea eugenioides TaxID=49369 RepID=UPI000F608D8E|nr:putative UPF0481 protein At3g02645 [Coffea eugenioides]